ncbi:hypothetical protein NMY22_g8742 [Coprinellus aureogranulatus]|nr:hypothetical protein NMY22_g8742 [Coprinellus aureogranulatus]
MSICPPRSVRHRFKALKVHFERRHHDGHDATYNSRLPMYATPASVTRTKRPRKAQLQGTSPSLAGAKERNMRQRAKTATQAALKADNGAKGRETAVPYPRQTITIFNTHIKGDGQRALHVALSLRTTLPQAPQRSRPVLPLRREPPRRNDTNAHSIIQVPRDFVRFEGEEVLSSALARTGSRRSSFCCSFFGGVDRESSRGELKSENATWASRVQGSAAQETLKPGSPEIVRRKDLWRNGWLLGLRHFARAIRVSLMGSGLGAAAASFNMGTAQVELEGNKTALRNLGYHSTLSKSPANKKEPLIYLETLHPRNGCEVLAEDIVRRLPRRTISVIYQKRVHESSAEFQPETTGISQRSLNPKKQVTPRSLSQEQSSTNAMNWSFKERKIRNTNYEYRLFTVTTSAIANDVPVCNSTSSPAPQVGDLCIQTDAMELHAWAFAALGWEKAVEGSPHPTLREYVCHFQERKVRWVQKKSMQTYSYRKKT